MIPMMRRWFLIFLCAVSMTSVMAQDDVEYKMEVGGGVGLLNYQGDFNGSLFKHMQPMGSVLVRRVFNPYMGLRASLGAGKIKGESKDAGTYYPDMEATPYKFDNLLGGTFVKGDEKNVFTANMPFGVGVKYKMGDRLNLGVSLAMHLSMSDELDGRKDPYGIKSSGLFKNTDCYTMLQVTLTYSFMAKCRTCHNDDE